MLVQLTGRIGNPLYINKHKVTDVVSLPMFINKHTVEDVTCIKLEDSTDVCLCVQESVEDAKFKLGV